MLQPVDTLDGPPFVTAATWAIADGKTGQLLWGHNAETPRPMASTTKMMTAWIVLELAREKPELLDEIVTISKTADETRGSTADVRAGEKFKVADLLYGLLLPSGNDAGVALGEHFGRRFGQSAAGTELDAETSLALFVAEMNQRAELLELKETRYFDPHGNSSNTSSARDLVKLAWNCRQNEAFRKYTGTRQHECSVTAADGTTRKVEWKNTNQLLEIEGYDGVKTGTTGPAGACLVSSGHRGGDQLLMAVLGSTSPEGRYVDSRNLYRWAWLQRGHQPETKTAESEAP